MKIGYARVSTKDQNLDRQIALLEKEGCDLIFSEKASGKSTYARPELKSAIGNLKPNDILVVAEWDRATRSYEDGFKLVEAVAKRGASIKVLDRSYLDLTTPVGKALLGLLSAWAEDERQRRFRQAEDGRKHARNRGVKFGRKPKLTPHQMTLALSMLDKGHSTETVAAHFNVGKSTIFRLKKRDHTPESL